jgi:O-antigen ligase
VDQSTARSERLGLAPAEYGFTGSGLIPKGRGLTVRTIVLCSFFASLNFEVGDPFNTGGVFTVSKLIGWIYVFTLVPQFKSFMAVAGVARFLAPLWLWFGLLTAMNVWYGQAGSFAILDYLAILQNILLFGFLVMHGRKERGVLEQGMLWFAVGAAAQAGMFRAGFGVEELGGRISMFGDGANGIGLRMGAGMTILALAVAQDPLKLGKLRYLLLLPLPFMLQLLVATGSRVALLSFGLALITGTALFKTKRMVWKISLLALGATVAFMVGLSVIASETLSSRLIASYYERDLAGRDVIWADLLPLVTSHPFLGSGQTGFAQFTAMIFGGFISPHNVFLEVLCYTGVVGLSLYLWFLWRVFQSGWKSYRTEGWLLPLLLWSPIVGCLVSGQVLAWKFVWCILAYNVASAPEQPNRSGREPAAVRRRPKPVISLTDDSR